MKKFAKSQRMKPLNLINIGLDEDFDDQSKIVNHNVNANGAISAMGNGRFNHKLHNFIIIILSAALHILLFIFSQKIPLKIPLEGGYSHNRYADTKIFG